MDCALERAAWPRTKFFSALSSLRRECVKFRSGVLLLRANWGYWWRPECRTQCTRLGLEIHSLHNITIVTISQVAQQILRCRNWSSRPEPSTLVAS
eukprot:3642327-Rhodomonas_salina.2